MVLWLYFMLPTLRVLSNVTRHQQHLLWHNTVHYDLSIMGFLSWSCKWFCDGRSSWDVNGIWLLPKMHCMTWQRLESLEWVPKNHRCSSQLSLKRENRRTPFPEPHIRMKPTWDVITSSSCSKLVKYNDDYNLIYI